MESSKPDGRKQTQKEAVEEGRRKEENQGAAGVCEQNTTSSNSKAVTSRKQPCSQKDQTWD